MNSRTPHSEEPSPVVLLVNDQEWVIRSLETVIAGEGCTVHRAYTGRQALAKARECLPDLIILDTQLPDINGPQVCRLLREDHAFGYSLPIFITTAGTNGRERQLEALEAGATEFFTQPFDGQVLILKIRNSLRARAVFETTRRAALTDPLTRLYNAQGLLVRAREVSALATRREEPVACLAVRPASQVLLDASSQVEDVALRLSGIFRQLVRASDVVGRLGPLEFVVLAPGTGPDGAARIAARIQAAMTGQDGAGMLPLAVGVAVSDADKVVEDAAEIMERASLAAVPPGSG